MVDLGTLGGDFSQALAVNDGGQVVGVSKTVAGQFHAFSWTAGGPMVDLGTLGGLTSEAFAVNDGGQVVGVSTTTAAGVQHAFSWTADDGMVDLGTLGGNFSQAAAVNDGGEVVGVSFTAAGELHAAQWTEVPPDPDGDGIFSEVDTLPAVFSDDFSDGVTTGTILDRGDQNLIVEDASDVAKGVAITADVSGGATPATVSICGGATTLSLTAGDQVTVTCGSVTIEVVSGPVGAVFLGDDGTVGTAELDTAETLTFDPATVTFTAPPSNPSVVRVTVDGSIFDVIPVDIKPGIDPNCINLNSNGVIPVAVLTTPGFDAATVDPFSVALEGASVRVRGNSGNGGSLEDVDGDGDLDLVLQIVNDLVLVEGQAAATLTGQTFGGVPIHGSDDLCVVP